MTGHLDLDALADLLATADDAVRPVAPDQSHLATCDLCHARLDALRDRSAAVNAALREGSPAGAGASSMPADVATRMTAILASTPIGDLDADPAADRGSRGHRWARRLAAAAAIVVIGGTAIPVAIHVTSRSSDSASESAAVSAADSATTPSRANAATSPTKLSSGTFSADVRALMASRSSSAKSGKPQAVAGDAVSPMCRRVATSTAQSLVPGGATGEPRSIRPAADVTVDGQAAELLIVGLDGQQVAIAVEDCDAHKPSVIAAAVL